MAAQIAIYVESLLGRGHLARAAALARALNGAGFAATLLTGSAGAPKDVATIPLPALRARDQSIKALVDPNGLAPDAAYWARRRAVLADAVAQLRPAAIVTESYPFARPRFADEAEALLDAGAAVGAVAIASVRDILVAKSNPDFYPAAAETARRRYARVLTHGDPAVLHFRETFPAYNRIAEICLHTGYLWTPPIPIAASAAGEVIVSTGGGRVGAALLATALEARSRSRVFGAARWRLIAGPDADRVEAAPDGFVIARACADLPALLQTAAASISRCGYNTAIEVAAADIPAVFVPFADDRQTEQALRADRFERMGFAKVVSEDRLSPEALASALDAAAEAPRPSVAIDLDGAAASVAAIRAAIS